MRHFAECGRRGITLRMGGFYGPESGYTQDTLTYARKGLAALLGSGDPYQSSIEDATRAALAARKTILLCIRQPTGIFAIWARITR